MDRDEIKNLFMQGIDCSQVVAGAFAKELGMEPDMLRKMAACFGGGMQCGETCGAVTGALMVIGLKYGHSQENDQKTKEEMTQKVAQFQAMFAERYPSRICSCLLGHDISKPEEMEKVLEKGLLFELCPRIVEDTVDILEKIL